MGRLLREEDVIYAIVEKGQHSKCYKLGETWELNGDEIRQALAEVDGISMYAWTPCAPDSMPENGQNVWISTVGHNVEPALYIPEIMRNDYVWEGEFSYLRKDEVLAWMPYDTPEPYMGDIDERNT